MGPHSCSTTWDTSGTHKGTWSLNTDEVCVELTPGFPLSRGVTGVVVLAPTASVICITVVVLGGDACFALVVYRGARTHVSVFYPHGQFICELCPSVKSHP